MTEDTFEHEVDLEDELADELDVEAQDQEHDAAAEPRPEERPATVPAFNYNDRLFAFGFSTCGKSEILNVIFSGIACQKVLLDTKPEFHIEGVEPVHEPEKIDWREPVIHYKPLPGSDCSQYEPIFEHGLTYPGPLLICVHEIQDLVDYKPQKAGRFLLGYAAKGGRLGKGLLAATQRPRLVPVSALTEAGIVVVLPPRLARQDDMVTASEFVSPVRGMPISAEELAAELAETEQQHGRYSSLWKDRRDPRAPLVSVPPLPDHLRALSIVTRLEDA